MGRAKSVKKNSNKPLPSDLSDHDERSEGMAVEKHWDEESKDPLAAAGARLEEFRKDNVPLSDEDWDEEEKKDDQIPDHVQGAVDDSLERLAEEELDEDEA
jgi:hypothetical protein